MSTQGFGYKLEVYKLDFNDKIAAIIVELIIDEIRKNP